MTFTSLPCTGRQTLNHWTARKSKHESYLFLKSISFCLCCCLGFSLVVESRDYSLVAVPKLLIAAASPVAEYKL